MNKPRHRAAGLLAWLLVLSIPFSGDCEMARSEGLRSGAAPGVRAESQVGVDTTSARPRRYAQLVIDLDLQLVPPGAPFFSARFSHAEHTRWIDCSSCHPGALSQRHAEMREIFAGRSCGRCHGTTAFVMVTECWRCHANLRRPRSAEAEADLARARKAPVPRTPQILEYGASMFQRLCAACHGQNGDGTGPLAAFLNPKPGDLADRSPGALATDDDLDLYRTLTMGISGTGMPPWSALSSRDRWALVHYVKSLSQSRNR